MPTEPVFLRWEHTTPPHCKFYEVEVELSLFYQSPAEDPGRESGGECWVGWGPVPKCHGRKPVGIYVCRAWHTGRHREAGISLEPAVIGRKGNANKARAGPAMDRLKEA